MIRPFALLLALVPHALAQDRATPEPMPSPARHAGTFHLATGTWTRHAPSTAQLGPDTIYRNDAPSGYFSTLNNGNAAGDWSILDSGRIPGVGGPVATADRTRYTVSGMEFAYCSDVVGPNVGITFSLLDSYAPCDLPTTPASPVHLAGTFSATGLPGSSSGQASCWTVTLDLSGGAEFCLEAEGGPSNPGYDGDLNLDSFGAQWVFNGVAGTNTGPILAGDPAWTTSVAGALNYGGGGTYYQASTTCGETGLDTPDFFAMDGPNAPIYNGCAFFGGYKNTNGCGGPSNRPLASFHSVLFADAGECSSGSGLCLASPNSAGPGVTLTYVPSASAGGGYHLNATGGPAGKPGYFLVSSQVGLPVPISQGQLCLTGTIGRYNANAGPGLDSIGVFDNLGVLVNAAGTGGPSGQGFDLPLDLPTPPGGTLAPGSTWYFQLWYRDNNPGPVTNFSDGVGISF